jgi:catechol 1,2-dioxygenase
MMQVPDDGPAGQLLKMMDRHPYRPGHIHVMVSLPTDPRHTSTNALQVHAEGYKSLTTQIFDKDTDYLENDSVFAVKDGLTVEFKTRKGDAKAEWDLEYNITLAPEDAKRAGSTPLSTPGN